MLAQNVRYDLLRRGFTRRHVGRAAALLAAGGALPFFNEAALAQFSNLGRRLPPDAVKINANENPLGPSQAALDALMGAAQQGGRYQYEETGALADTIAEVEGIGRECVLPYPGSSLGLHHAVLAFTSPERGLVTADPGYEAPERAADFIGAKVSRVPLNGEAAEHDIPAMLEADPRPGLYYVCNPNNPTGTVTPRQKIEALIENKPEGSLVLIDEAYIHFSDEPHSTDFVKAGKDVIVLRTFSKIYGMAGLRAGFAMARGDLLARMRPYMAGALPATAMVAARASLLDAELVPTRKKINREVRDGVIAFLRKRGFKVTPSVSNKFMVDTRRPAYEVIRALAERKVYIGRPWSSWPTWTRISVGTREEMDKFCEAFSDVVSA